MVIEEMRLVLLQIFIILYRDFSVKCEWADSAHYYVIHAGEYTWNDARETCRQSGDQLLMIQNETEWSMWIELLNATHTPEHRSSDGIYWFGLHAPDTGSPNNYYWDDCTLPQYMEPAVDDYPVTDYVCITMWIRREVFNSAFMDMWLKGRMCNETHSFICTVDTTGCVPTCDEMIINTDSVTCDILCDDIVCQSTYFHQVSGVTECSPLPKLKLCHVMPITYSESNLFYLCYLPSADYIPTTCTGPPDFTAVITKDENMNVTDTVCMGTVNNATNTTASPDDSTCLCSKLWTFLAQPPPEEVNLTIEEKVEKIVEELTVNKRNTTVTLRKYVSVMDHRPSSVGIGIVAGIIIFAIFGIIVLFDLSTIWHEIRHVLMKAFKCLRPNRVMHQDPVGELAKAIGAVPFALATGGRFKKFPKSVIESNTPFVMTAGGRFKAISKQSKEEMTETPTFVWTAGGRIKTFTSKPPKYGEKKSAPARNTNGLGWLMREQQIYNDHELPTYPSNNLQRKTSPETPQIITKC